LTPGNILGFDKVTGEVESDLSGGERLERKLTAILCADVYGYSRLTGENEEATHRTLKSYRKLIDALIDQHHGRFVHSAGDSVLAEFGSVVNAVQCAVEIQTALKAENARLPAERRMEFRIGINLGDVIVDGVEIYGDGVNVAPASRVSPTPAPSSSQAASASSSAISCRSATPISANNRSRTSPTRFESFACCSTGWRRRAEGRDGFHESIGGAACSR
jgi:class 3 adenylate cyclase